MIYGIGNRDGTALNQCVVLDMRAWHDDAYVFTAEFTIISELADRVPYQSLPELDLPSGVTLADPKFEQPGKIDLLFGAGIWAKTVGHRIYRNPLGTALQETDFGFVVFGRFCAKSDETRAYAGVQEADSHLRELQLEKLRQQTEELNKTLMKFWEVEELSKKRIRSHEEEMVEQVFVQKHQRMSNGRYMVDIPIWPDAEPLGNSRDIAVRRFMWLEKRLQRDPVIREQYIAFMREYEQLGHMQVAESTPALGVQVVYIPHHCVVIKFRVVFDASCKTSTGISFNQIQMVGEKLQFDLADIIVRFRRHKFAVVGDIKKMFRQVGINPKQWDLQRIVWREHPSHPLREYHLKVVTYGMASSVYNSVRAMQQCAKDHAHDFPDAAEAVHKDFYVDDCFTGADEEQGAAALCKDIDTLLMKGGFEMCKWASNSSNVLQRVQGAEGIIEMCDEVDAKVLGLRWLTATDELTFRVTRQSMPERPTKRQMLSEIAKLYDPNGFLGPAIVVAKLMMQDSWRFDIGWDQKIPVQMTQAWNEFYGFLPRIAEVKLPRWLGMSKKGKVQLHGFSDASNKAYGAVVYIRGENEQGKIYCQLIASKSRVAPTKTVSIPRLELLAAELLSNLVQCIMEACELKNAEYYLWTDSMIVLHWIRKLPCDMNTFVANRVATIQTVTKVGAWAHVRSEDNPADLLSRGMTIPDFVNCAKWFHGPDWLRKPQAEWPIPKLSLSDVQKEQLMSECRRPEHEKQLCFGLLEAKKETLIMKHSSWDRVMRITAAVMRYVHNFQVKWSKSKCGEPSYGFLTQMEIRRAVNYWIRAVQAEHYKQEILCRQNGDVLPARSAISGLNPQLNADGILYAKGRLTNANLPNQQLIIPPKSRLGWLLMQKAHRETLHGGAQAMMAYIRTGFWIPRLRSELRMFIHKCAPCVRQAAEPVEQLMGNLPMDRVRPARAFSRTGVDYAGPFEIRRAAGRPPARKSSDKNPVVTDKGYVAVFVCLVTRAVHLEAVMGMTSEAFLAAFRRFIARRGHVEHMYSDNGTTFVGAEREMREAVDAWQHQNTLEFVQSKSTEWHFITPSAPFQGGIWESAVKSMKHHLRRVMGAQKFSYEVLSTLLAEIEACLNSRPICAMSDDIDDARALTPAHFLIGEELVTPIPVPRDEPPRSTREFWKLTEHMVQDFWKPWQANYLNTLQQRRKWKKEYENVRVGQLALLSNENLPPTYWALGRITEVRPGTDGLVRNVSIIIDGKEYDRPVQKLCIIPTDSELDYWR